jgi:PST family polysaccharide transporter
MAISGATADSRAVAIDFRRVAIGGAFLTGIGQAARFGLQAAAIFILARLLRPSDFGITAMVFPILVFANVLQEAGLGAALIQRESLSRGELGTLFWLNSAFGLLLALILLAGAPLVAAFYGEPRLTALTSASAALVVISALGAQPISLLNRDMRYGRLAIVDTVSQAIGFTLAVGVAAVWHSYWAIWLMSAGQITSSAIIGWLLGGVPPTRFAPVRKVADMLAFGGHLTIFNIFNHFGRNLDNILIGWRWGDVALGYYDRAYKLLLLPLLVVSSPLQRIMVPILARTRDNAEQHRRAYLSTLQIALLLTAPLVALLVAAPANAIRVILGPGWEGAAPIFGWLGIASMLQLLTNSFGWIYISQGRARHMMLAGAASSMWAAGAFLIGLPWGARGVACAYAISEFFRTPVLIWWVTREGPVCWRDIAEAALPFVPAVLFALGMIRLANVSTLWNPLPLFTLSGVVAYASMIAGLLVTKAGRECVVRVARFGLFGASIATARLRPSRA